MEIVTYETVLEVCWTGSTWREGDQPQIATEVPQPRLVVTRGTKPCKSCGIPKRISEFPVRKNTCKKCVSVYHKHYRQMRHEANMPLILEAEGAA